MGLNMKVSRQLQFEFLVVLLCFLGLEYMHYTILDDRVELSWFSYIENIAFAFIDLCLLFLIPFRFVNKRSYLFFIPFVLILLFVVVNLVYSRYFSVYLPPTLYREFGNLDGLDHNILAGFRVKDLFLVVILSVALLFYGRFRKQFTGVPRVIRVKIAKFAVLSVICLVSGLLLFSRINWPTLHSKYVLPYGYAATESNFKYGVVYSTAIQLIIQRDKSYSTEDLRVIRPYLSGPANPVRNPARNVQLIIVESLMSFATDCRIGDMEITPNLNQLVREGAYYNNNMTTQIGMGESSDGQMIYLTGLLPEKGSITIIDYFNNTFLGLPTLLKKERPKTFTKMFVPTSPKMWRQDAMCVKYGLDSLYSRNNYKNSVYNRKWLNDQVLFEFAASHTWKDNEPFMSVLLTSSTHTPYDTEHEPTDIPFPADYPNQLKIYLSNVHYMDKYLGKYIDYLKENDLFNNTLIVVASDHSIGKEWLNAQTMDIKETIPLYIINSPVPIELSPDSAILQVDVFPTILDLMGLKTIWRGVGTSLLTPDSVLNSGREQERRKRMNEISTLIFNSDYFSKFPLLFPYYSYQGK